MPDDGPVIDRLAVPLVGERVGIDLERIIHRPDPRPAEIFRYRTRRCRSHDPAIRIPELWPLIRSELDLIAAFVDISVMEAASCRVSDYAG